MRKGKIFMKKGKIFMKKQTGSERKEGQKTTVWPFPRSRGGGTHLKGESPLKM